MRRYFKHKLEILQGANDLAKRTEDQAASIEKTSVAMVDLSATVRQNSDIANQASDLTLHTSSSADEGAAVMGRAVAAMEGIEESAVKISEIVVMIDEIAFQTNLLALNAAVEAARAGEAGKLTHQISAFTIDAAEADRPVTHSAPRLNAVR